MMTNNTRMSYVVWFTRTFCRRRRTRSRSWSDSGDCGHERRPVTGRTRPATSTARAPPPPPPPTLLARRRRRRRRRLSTVAAPLAPPTNSLPWCSRPDRPPTRRLATSWQRGRCDRLPLGYARLPTKLRLGRIQPVQSKIDGEFLQRPHLS